MVKLIFLCRRRADLTHAEYARRLLEGHVPIALRHHPLMREYVVNVVETTPTGAAELDSIGVLGFDSLADFRERLYDSPDGERIVARDVQRFMGGAHGYVTTEFIQLAGSAPVARGVRSPGIKLMCPLRRRPGMTHAEFVDQWMTRHVPLALRAYTRLARYVTNIVDGRLAEDVPELDAIAELQFGAAEVPPAQRCNSLEDERALQANLARLTERAVAYRVGEYVQKLAGN